MMPIEKSAPGKVILCGEHSVVYGYPAIATPVHDVRTIVQAVAQPKGTGLLIHAVDLGKTFSIKHPFRENPLVRTAQLVLDTVGCPEPDVQLTITSQIPIAAGMGSGAAVTVATIRTLSAYLGQNLENESVSDLTFEIEKIYHGAPSGIDNTVITWERPVYFRKGHPPVFCEIGTTFHLLIASCGIPASTRKAINFVREHLAAEAQHVKSIFNHIGTLTDKVSAALAHGQLTEMGKQLSLNHKLLVDLGVSTEKLDGMVSSALTAGALGAKLTGSGQGGNIIALVEENQIAPVRQALANAGSHHIWHTR
ncbi:MAG: mevalonate kinase, partial [Anaerolineae bacterium]|nr:mevalonate kinase [Anaerolineae bacterium]